MIWGEREREEQRCELCSRESRYTRRKASRDQRFVCGNQDRGYRRQIKLNLCSD